MARVTKTLKGYFVEHNGQLYGPVAKQGAAEELAIYIVAKKKEFVLKGNGVVNILGEPPYICYGEIVIHNTEQTLKRKKIKRLYQLEARINPKARQEQLLNRIIATGKEVPTPDDKDKHPRL